MIHLLLIEPTALLRSALARALDGYDEFKVVNYLSGTEQAKPITQPLDVVIIDLGQLVGVNIERTFPGCAILALVDAAVPGWIIREMIGLHILGLFSKGRRLDELAEVIQRVAKGKQMIDTDLAIKAVRARPNPLTAREHQILLAARDGATTKKIAEDLLLSVGTVRNHFWRILTKLDAENRRSAISLAEKNGWLWPPNSGI